MMPNTYILFASCTTIWVAGVVGRYAVRCYFADKRRERANRTPDQRV